MAKTAINEHINPFLESEKEMGRIENLEMEVDLLRREIDLLMGSVTLLMQCENYRVEKIRKK